MGIRVDKMVIYNQMSHLTTGFEFNFPKIGVFKFDVKIKDLFSALFLKLIMCTRAKLGIEKLESKGNS